jgi:hypothetical protein
VTSGNRVCEAFTASVSAPALLGAWVLRKASTLSSRVDVDMAGRNVRWKKLMASGCSGVKKLAATVVGSAVLIVLKGL